MKRKLLLLILLFIPYVFFAQTSGNNYREMTLLRYNREKRNFVGGEKIILKEVLLLPLRGFSDNKINISDSDMNHDFFAFISDEALDWLADYAEKDSMYHRRVMNIYGVVVKMKKKVSEDYIDDFLITKIELSYDWDQ